MDRWIIGGGVVVGKKKGKMKEGVWSKDRDQRRRHE